MLPSEIGYVLKRYPRFSETFIVTEILAREAQGERISIFALRSGNDPRFHPELARVAALVQYLPQPYRPATMWQGIAAALPELGDGLLRAFPELLAAEAEEASAAIELARHAKQAGLRHLHAHFATSATVVARLASLITGIPYSFTAHAKDLFHESVDRNRLRKLIADAAYVATVSQFNARLLEELSPQHAHRIHLVPNSIEVERFPLRAQRERKGTFHIVAIGRFVEKKGFDVLLRALSLVREQGMSAQLTLVGSGELDADLRAQCLELGLRNDVSFPGPLSQDAVSALLGEADVFVAPCVIGADGNADGLPTVLLEAMAVGVPCISTRVTGIPEVIIDGRTGVLCEPGDVEGLSEALWRVERNEVDVHALVSQARALVEQRHDAEGLARHHADLTSVSSTNFPKAVA